MTLLAFALLLAVFAPVAQAIEVHNADTPEERAAIRDRAAEIGAELPGMVYILGVHEGVRYTVLTGVATRRDRVVSAWHGLFLDKAKTTRFEYMLIGSGNMVDGALELETVHSATDKIEHPDVDVVVYDLSDDPLPERALPNVSFHEPSIGDPVTVGGYGWFSQVGAIYDQRLLFTGDPDVNVVITGEAYGFRSEIASEGWGNSPAWLDLYTVWFSSRASISFHEEGGLAISGDSGGPVYRKEDDGLYTLTGINIRNGGRGYGSRTGFLPFSNIQSLIEPHLPSNNGVIANPHGDHDGDGQTNFAEWAHGSDPNDSASRHQTLIQLRGSGADRVMVVSYLRRLDGSVAYSGEFSEDLSEWVVASEGTPDLEKLPPAPATHEWASFEIRTAGRTGFARIVISLNGN